MPTSSRRERNREAIWRSMALGRRSDIFPTPDLHARLNLYANSRCHNGCWTNYTLPDGQIRPWSGVFLRHRPGTSLHTARDQKFPSRRQGQNALLAFTQATVQQRGRLNGRLAFGAKLFSRFAQVRAITKDVSKAADIDNAILLNIIAPSDAPKSSTDGDRSLRHFHALAHHGSCELWHSHWFSR